MDSPPGSRLQPPRVDRRNWPSPRETPLEEVNKLTELSFRLRAPQAVVIQILVIVLVILGFGPWAI